MTKKIELEPAFLLHRRNFRDSSLILEFFTLNHGRVNLISKGARGGKSKIKGYLLPFIPLLISWNERGSLPNLSQIEILKNDFKEVTGSALMTGLYLNELLIKLLSKGDAHPRLFHLYQECLFKLAQENKKEIVRVFEKKMLIEIGYGICLDRDSRGCPIKPEYYYQFRFGEGFHQIGLERRNDLFMGKNILALHFENFESQVDLLEVKILLQKILAVVLGDKKINAFQVFKTWNFFVADENVEN